MDKLFIVRHGETGGDYLNQEGADQIEWVAKRMKPYISGRT